jgi:hypothetical protein
MVLADSDGEEPCVEGAAPVSWRCVNCGERVDDRIVANRGQVDVEPRQSEHR